MLYKFEIYKSDLSIRTEIYLLAPSIANISELEKEFGKMFTYEQNKEFLTWLVSNKGWKVAILAGRYELRGD